MSEGKQQPSQHYHYYSVDDSETRAAIEAGEFVPETVEVECICCHRTIFLTVRQHAAYARENKRYGDAMLLACSECWWAIQQYRRQKRIAELN
jgi:hypothetical protein